MKITSSILISGWLASWLLMGCSGDYYSESDFATTKKFDTHIHIHTNSDAVFDQALADNFRLINVSVDAPSNPSLTDQEKFSLDQVSRHSQQIEYATAFHLKKWDSVGWASEVINQLQTSFTNGALGIKIWKNIGMVEKDSSGNFIMIDNPRFDPVIQFTIDQNKTVMGHLGEPLNCWLPLDQMTVNNDRSYFKNHPEYHMYLHPEYPSYEDQINARDRFLARHPDMRFVGAHLGSLEYDVDSLARRLDQFPNMAVDMAARVCHLQYQTINNREKVRNFFIQYQDRLIYATDHGMDEGDDPEKVKNGLHNRWLEDWKYFVTDQMLTVDEVNGEFQGLKLPKAVVDKIFYQNAVKWFSFTE